MIATGAELFEARQFSGVVALCMDALANEPECLPLLMLRARARIALRLDLEAQADLRDIVRIDPRCALAYRLLGELAARRNDNTSAAALFGEALRLNPDDREAYDWLLIVEALVPEPEPAPPPSRRPSPTVPARASAVRREASAAASPHRFPRGTQPPAEPETNERPTQPFISIARHGDARRTTSSTPRSGSPTPSQLPRVTVTGRPAPLPPAKQAPRLAPAPRSPSAVRSIVERPGFGEYLVASGILTRERLRAAEAYQRSMKVQLSTAIVTLGLVSPQRIAWAAVAHESQQP